MKKFIALLILILAVRLVIFYFYQPRETVIRKNPVTETTVFTGIKSHIKSVYSRSLSAQDAGLLMGIVFGEKDLSKSETKKYQVTGVLHVVAASGMNVSMLTSFLLVFLLLFLRRQQALIATFAAILFYTALADFQPSIVRAAIMGGFALGAGIMGRQNTSVVALFFAAFAMVFWDPTVITSVSFILSFAATLGIIILDPLFKFGVFKKEFFEDFRTTLAAQIATTPILLFFFGTYSPISVLVNFLVLWTVPPLMILGGVAAILSFIPILSAPFVLLSLPLLSYFRAIIDLFAAHSIPLKLDSTPWTIIVGYYLVLLAVVIWINQNRRASKKSGK